MENRIALIVVFLASIATLKAFDGPPVMKMIELQPATKINNHQDMQEMLFQLFLQFVKDYDKKYPNKKEFDYRYEVFKKNIIKALEFGKNDHATGQYGVNKFSDMTNEEFKSFYAMKKWPNEIGRTKQAMIPALESLPKSFDWRTKGAVTPVKNQKRCGSCWAFSTTGNIEGQWYLRKGKLYSLSEQELVDCDKIDHGCAGGLPLNAYKSIIHKLGGLETEKEYPYVAKNRKCKLNRSEEVVYINSSVKISTNEKDIAAWLVAHGPVSIGINAVNMQHYKKGIAHPTKSDCDPTALDHGVLIVGYGQENGTPYWIIKNSWGNDWGEKGYYRVIRGIGACGLNTAASSAIIY